METVLSLLSMTVRMSTPLILCVVGGVYAQRAGVFNIALDGIMNFGAFGGIWFTVAFGGALLGSGMGVLLSVLLTLIFAFFVIKLKANAIIVGIAINFIAESVPKYLLTAYYGTRGSLVATNIIDPMTLRLDVPVLRNIPVLGDIFNYQTPLTYASILIFIILTIVLYKTKFGIYVRVTGENQEAAKAVGIKVNNIKYWALIISAVTCGLAGLNLSVESLGMYTASMTAGRGFICLSAIVCGRREPVRSMLFALLFGFTRALQVMLASVVDSVTASLIGTLPYLAILVVLLVTETPRARKNTMKIFTDIF